MVDRKDQPWTGPFPIKSESGRFEVSVPSEDDDVDGTIVATLVPITAIPEQRKLVWLGFTDAAGVSWARVADVVTDKNGRNGGRPPSAQLPEAGTSDEFGFVTQLWEVGAPRPLRSDLLHRQTVLPQSWQAALEESAATNMTQGLGRKPDATTEQIAGFLREHLVNPLTGVHLPADDRSRREIPLMAGSELDGIVTEVVTAGGTGMGLTFRTPATDATGGNDVYYLAGGRREGQLPAEFWFGHLDRKQGPRISLRAELLASAPGQGKRRIEDWTSAPDSLRQAVVEVIRRHAAGV
jgi:hypothetical protein